MTRSGRASTSLLSDADLFLFDQGTHYRLYDKLGAHLDSKGAQFAVWAPAARSVSVIGGFNGWDPRQAPLHPRGNSGIWEGHVSGVRPGAFYKYHIASRIHGYSGEVADPFAVRAEEPPATGSVVWPLDYDWGDDDWMSRRHERQRFDAPLSIYELHLGSWMCPHDGQRRHFGYRELAPLLADYVRRLGFTHVQLLPVMEHPFYGSWGYQTTGYYAPTARYGSPQDFMFLVDHLHQCGIGVILDWVPSHFPGDGHALGFFDGTHLFEHADPRKGFHPDWNSLIFNYGRGGVRSFLISSAMFWLNRYHADGIRVDAVASMLYLDYSREEGQWEPNRHGGRENLEAIDFIRELTDEVRRSRPDTLLIAEESTAWPGVCRSTDRGGLGFDYKWDMGWMHDTLEYMACDPLFRGGHHDKLTFRMLYAYSENFTMPLSHDEVVHGKRSLLDKMAGDVWQKFANLRLLYSYMWGQPGKKLLFMGGEFGQWREWSHESELSWGLLQDERHDGLRRCVERLNHLYREEGALHQRDVDPRGFRWIDCEDAARSLVAFLRMGAGSAPPILVACNFTPVPREHVRLGVPVGGSWDEIFNSDATEYGGSGMGNMGQVETEPHASHGQPQSLSLTLPPLAAVFLRPCRE